MRNHGKIGGLLQALAGVLFARCYTVAQDKTCAAAEITLGPSALGMAGLGDTALNLIRSIRMALYSGGTVKVNEYYGETSPVGEYASAPVGSVFYQYTASASTISAVKVWLKTTSTVWTNIYGSPAVTTLYGAAATGTTAAEYVSGNSHRTVLTVSTTLGAIAGGANLALGKLVYTLPAGNIIVKRCYMSMALDESDGNIAFDTPDVGIGTTVASGAVAVLGGTAAFENILTGQTAADCNGTATVVSVGTILPIAATGDRTVYFNVADGWAASGEAACGIAGTIVLDWEQMA